MKHSNGHATHAAPELDLVEGARLHLEAQKRLAADAATQFERTLRARADAEEGHATDVDAVAAAREACEASPTDEQLDAIPRAQTREALSRAKLAEAVKAHESRSSTLTTAERAVADAERALERVHLELEVPARRGAISARGGRVLVHALALFDELRALREDLDADAKAATRARELGSALEPSDGLSAAAGFLRELLERGLDVGGGEVHAVRWAFELRPNGRLAPSITETAAKVSSLAFAALSREPNPNGRARVETALAAWRDFGAFSEVTRAAAPRAPSAPAPAGWLTTGPDLSPTATRVLHEGDVIEWEGDV